MLLRVVWSSPVRSIPSALMKKPFAVVPCMSQGSQVEISSPQKLWLTGLGVLSPRLEGQPQLDISVMMPQRSASTSIGGV